MANYSYFSSPLGSGLQRFLIQTLPKCRGLKGFRGISESKARAPKEPKATAKAKPSGAKGQAKRRQRTSKAAVKVGRQAPKEPKAKAKAKQGGAKGQARPRQWTSKAALKVGRRPLKYGKQAPKEPKAKAKPKQGRAKGQARRR